MSTTVLTKTNLRSKAAGALKVTVKRIREHRAKAVKPADRPRRQKLTEADVKAILSDRASETPSTINELAAQYGVKVPTITHILYGITWKSIPR